MRLTRTGKPDNFYYYVIEDYKNDKGQKKTRTVESLGCARVIREKFGVDDAQLNFVRIYLKQTPVRSTTSVI